MKYRYNDAMATIRRFPSMEHNFQLVITRVYEDGDQEFLEDEEESESNLAYLFILSTYNSIFQPMKSESFSFPRNSSFGQARRRVVPLSYGAIYMAASMSSGSMLHLVLTNLRALSLRHACTVPCMSANIRRALIVAKMLIWKSSFGSKRWLLYTCYALCNLFLTALLF